MCSSTLVFSLSFQSFACINLIRVCVCFFFQAEDGILDLVRSRGLGDVYKRQPQDVAGRMAGRAVVDGRNLLDASAWQHAGFSYTAVSYTHLTLPTSDLV